MMQTRVRFKDGTEENETWEHGEFREHPARVLTAAVILAELRHPGEDHDGAWLEFRS